MAGGYFAISHSLVIAPTSPNHALQRTAPRVTVAAVHVRSRLLRAGRCLTSVASFFAPPSQLPRRAPQSLSLRSLGDTPRFPFNEAVFPTALSMTRHLLRSEFCAESLAGQAGPPRSWAASSGFGGASAGLRFGLQTASVSTPSVTPNHALQRTAPARPTGCSHRLRPQPLFRSQCAAPPRSLSLGSLGDFARLPYERSRR